MTKPTDQEAWDRARFEAIHARDALAKINGTPQIAHAQAEGVLVGFIRKVGFGKLADKYESMREERGWSYGVQ